MKVKIQPEAFNGEALYVSLPFNVEKEYVDLLCTGDFEEYAGYLTPIIRWLQAEYGFGEFDRSYDSKYAPGETFLSFHAECGYRSVTLY